MRKLIAVFILFFPVIGYSQVDEVKKAQNTRKDYISPERSNSKKLTSKSLFVNPFIGTGGHGHTFPGATAPFGMMQLSPDTRHTGWDGCSGYHYSDSVIYGFSHTHLSGTGVSDYGDLLIVPQSGKPRIDPGYESTKGYGSSYSHLNEKASPGYYEVHLNEPNIDVRLTVSTRSGIHNYKFNKIAGKKFIVLDLDHRDRLISSELNLMDDQTISGSRVSEAWATEQHFYFYLKIDTPYQKARIFNKRGRNKVLLVFPKEVSEINIRVGMSAVDIDGAKNNLEHEIPDFNFNKVRANVVNQWNKELDRIHFESNDDDVMTNFYSALYHSFIAPNVFSDVDGKYRGRDNKIHTLEDLSSEQYTVFSLWDTYRATHPLFTLTQVDRTNNFIHTFLRQFNEGGDLPVWELAGNETECMIGFHSVSVIADAFSKGIRGFNEKAALEAMITSSGLDEFAKIDFKRQGYIDSGIEPESVSKALEYSYDHYCIGLMRKELMNDAGSFEHSQFNFINHFDPSTKFMRARRNGLWFHPFDPSEVNFNYTEANSWQYSMYAPHAVGVLRDLIGGADSLEAWLDRLFTTEMSLTGRHQADITGLIGQYAHGNEPSHHMAYLYNYTNAQHKTQFYLNKIQNELYRNAPDGLSGNEDCGQMSSWYVLSALGLYQIAPGNPYYEIGKPLTNYAEINQENGNRFIVKTNKLNPEAKYINKIVLNGSELDRLYLSHEEILNGGSLEITLSKNPTSKLYKHAPTLSRIPDSFVALPYFNETTRVFEDSLTLSLATIENKDHTIYYTIDDSDPTEESMVYKTPIKIDETATIKALTIAGNSSSAIISNTFVKTDKSITIDLKSEYDSQYAASGPLALIDGINGGNEFRTGDWQGFWAQDVEIEMELNEPKTIDRINIGCLSDMKSWIFLPKSIEVSYSFDGINFEKNTITATIEPEDKSNMSPHKKNVILELNTQRSVKKIRILVINSGICPEWHLGSGNDTWLFLDEIILN